MELLLFFGVLALVVAAPLVWLTWPRNLKPGSTPMVLLAAAAGEPEMHMWKSALRNAGINPRIVNVGDIRWEGPQIPYQYEFWVREKDAHEARRVLGL